MARPVENMLAAGNTKLGDLIHSFSIPAVTTCPGASALCRAACYATKGHFRQNGVKNRHRANYERAQLKAFARDMISEIRRRFVRVVRVHVAGDFFSREYIMQWVAIAKACPDTRFFAYTRSWNARGMRLALRALAKVKNFYLWLSTDSSMPKPPTIPRTRIAFLATSEADEANTPPDADLVFRDDASIPRRYINSVRVCPYEDGIVRKTNPRFTCSSCRICWTGCKTRHQAPASEPALVTIS